MRYRLLRAATHDQRWLDQLRRSVNRELCIAIYGSWDEARHVQQTRACWDRGPISLIEVEAVRVGMIQMLDRSGEVEIAELQIQLSHQNRGIAGRIVNDIVDQAHKRGKSVTVSVELQNQRAYEFFRHRGFSQVSATTTHYQLQCEP